MTEIKLGIYRHYKGPLYQVLGIAHDANADLLGIRPTWKKDSGVYPPPPAVEPLGERTVVVYIGLQLDSAHLGPRLAVRTLEDFLGDADVEPYPRYCSNRSECGGGNHVCCGHETTTIERFTYLGQELTREMLDQGTRSNSDPQRREAGGGDGDSNPLSSNPGGNDTGGNNQGYDARGLSTPDLALLYKMAACTDRIQELLRIGYLRDSTMAEVLAEFDKLKSLVTE